ncbi:MAG: hypothetical protein R6X25_13125 [Candidatus Krumholzibacteriia bacterium]
MMKDVASIASRAVAALTLPAAAALNSRAAAALVACLVLGAATSTAAASRSSDRPQVPVADHLPVAEVEAGMTGYGLTVFAGSTVDTFQVRVLGTQERARAAGNLIMVELLGPRVAETSVAQGMSGSPIYLGGRFAGAVAFGWPGALRPIAGITPAGEMLALGGSDDGPLDPSAADLAGGGADPLQLLAWSATASVLARELLDLPETAPAGAPALPSGWVRPEELWPHLFAAVSGGRVGTAPTGGWQSLPVTWIHAPLGSGAPASDGQAPPGSLPPVPPATGRGDTDETLPLVPGAACAVPLILGDAQLGAVGTVTWVDGDRVLMMGHPFLQRGPVRLPLASAEIVTVFPSRAMSFKIGTIGPVVGEVIRDQRAGLVGRLGSAPPLIPVSVNVRENGRSRSYDFDVADDPQLSPALVFWCLYNALLVEGDDQSRQTLRYELVTRWDLSDGDDLDPVVLTGQVAGPGGAAGLAPEWMAPLQVLLNNRHRPLQLRSVEAHLEVTRPMEVGVVSGLAAPATVYPGQEVAVRVPLETYRADDRTEEFVLTLPAFLEPGRYRLVAASARELFALEAQRAEALFQDRSLAATLDLVRSPRSASTLVVALVASGRNPVVVGRELANLPGSLARTLRPGPAGATASTLAVYVVRRERPTDLTLSGHAIRDITVVPAAEPTREESRP